MLGTHTVRSVRDAAQGIERVTEDLAPLREDVQATLSEVKSAAQSVSELCTVAVIVLAVAVTVWMLATELGR